MRHFSLATFMLCAAATGGCQHPTSAPIASNTASLQAARDALNEGEAGTSLAIARGILSRAPNDVAALDQAGDAQAALNDRIIADTTYKRALAIAPHDAHARLGLGKLQVRDDPRAAESTFRAVLADAPRDPLALNDLGYVLDLQEHHTEAQVYYRQALSIDPNRMSTRTNLALSMALSGRPFEAEGMMRDVAASSAATPRMRMAVGNSSGT